MSDETTMDPAAATAAVRTIAESVDRAESALGGLSSRAFDAAHAGRDHGARAAHIDARLRELEDGLASWNRVTRSAAEAIGTAVTTTEAGDALGAASVTTAGGDR
ncbi:hypothetical protein [Rhodococcoides corynebacterioides]|uniref:hypothetical protein n=1 Tax=Rhodococcoides corynebacterioides TaxID=53972 RepID=UPI001C9A813F|nr:hypothetical protein [Rhodococcus corynebacterioides]MBY6363127.1 hypothetical protein [Rhodococcus corynebacterioides]